MIYDLREEHCEAIQDSLPGKIGDRGRCRTDNRAFISAAMWIARTGAPWSALPSAYEKWSNVHKKFIRCAKAGVWQMQMIFNTLAVNEDNKWIMLDRTLIRAHQQQKNRPSAE